MADISTLTTSIIKEAENEAQEIINASREKAQKIVEKTEIYHKELLQKLKNDADIRNNLENKSFESKKKKIYENTLHAARMDFYYQVIEEAKAIIKNTSSDTQLSFIIKKLENINIPNNSKISFSTKISDNASNKICKKFGMEKDKKINDFGFILKTPSYKENFTTDSLFEEKRADFIKFLHIQTEAK